MKAVASDFNGNCKEYMGESGGGGCPRLAGAGALDTRFRSNTEMLVGGSPRPR